MVGPSGLQKVSVVKQGQAGFSTPIFFSSLYNRYAQSSQLCGTLIQDQLCDILYSPGGSMLCIVEGSKLLSLFSERPLYSTIYLYGVVVQQGRKKMWLLFLSMCSDH